MFCLHVCLCTMYMPDSQGGQKKVLDSLKLESQTVENHHVGARKRT